MLDPIVTAALVVLVAQGLKYLAALANFPVDETTLNTIAAAIVTWLLAQFVRGRIHAAVKGNARAESLLIEKE
jgi:hypothetical protein